VVNRVSKRRSVRLYLFQVHSLDSESSSIGRHFDRRLFVAFKSALSLKGNITTVHELGRERKSVREKVTKRCGGSDSQQYFEDGQYIFRKGSLRAKTIVKGGDECGF
jgi:hypothetical protein